VPQKILDNRDGYYDVYQYRVHDIRDEKAVVKDLVCVSTKLANYQIIYSATSAVPVPNKNVKSARTDPSYLVVFIMFCYSPNPFTVHHCAYGRCARTLSFSPLFLLSILPICPLYLLRAESLRSA
jgi:hypothetical protein